MGKIKEAARFTERVVEAALPAAASEGATQVLIQGAQVIGSGVAASVTAVAAGAVEFHLTRKDLRREKEQGTLTLRRQVRAYSGIALRYGLPFGAGVLAATGVGLAPVLIVGAAEVGWDLVAKPILKVAGNGIERRRARKAQDRLRRKN